MDFPDSAWELGRIIDFHMDNTFTWHLVTCLQETGLNHIKRFSE